MIANSTSSLGGGLYINNPEYMLIQNTSFKSNVVNNDSTLTSSGLGGAIYYTCDNSYLCQVNITNYNSFVDNYAANSGGAIKWDDLEPIFDESNQYINNYAALYGNNIASFAQMVISIN